MSAGPDSAPRPDGRPAAGSVRRPARWVSWVIGVALLVLAGWAIGRAGVPPASLIERALASGWQRPAALLALVAVTPVFTSAIFWVLTRRYGKVGFGENTALITSAWLLNFAPMSPGLIGRLAYLKRVHGVAIGHSARAVIWANLLSVVAGAVTLLTLGAAALFWRGDDPRLAALVAAPIVMVGVFAWYAHKARPKPDPEVWRVVAALAIRLAEVHLWAARYAVVFAMLGQPLAWGGALAVASISTLALLFPLAPNGLGVREWAVGLVAPLLPASIAYSAGLTTASGLSADMVHRAAEVVVAVPLGLVATAWVWARLARAKQGEIA